MPHRGLRPSLRLSGREGRAEVSSAAARVRKSTAPSCVQIDRRHVQLGGWLARGPKSRSMPPEERLRSQDRFSLKPLKLIPRSASESAVDAFAVAILGDCFLDQITIG